MKKLILAVIAICLLTTTSCIKKLITSPINVTQVGGGTWSFAGIIDTAHSCIYMPGSGNQGMTASNATNFVNYTTIRCGYFDSLFTGTYTVVPTTSVIGPHQMSFEIDYGLGGTNGNSYYSTGLIGNTVNVTVSGNKVTVSGSGIQIYQIPLSGNPNASDTTTLALNIYAPYN